MVGYGKQFVKEKALSYFVFMNLFFEKNENQMTSTLPLPPLKGEEGRRL
ncbi:MAG: hypothetical protein LUG44_02690 [Clostridiales bacterium]|nr:hypothetical protein [Clostridiales bacterium]